MIKIVKIKEEFINFLRTIDNRVFYNKGQKRPYIGVLFSIGTQEYYAPLSSPKEKHKSLNGEQLDVILIQNAELGVINLNNMIPTLKSEIINFDINKEPDRKYKALLINQFLFINENEEKIIKKAELLYNLRVKKHLPKPIYYRCCNFEKLEKSLKQYKSTKKIKHNS